MSSQDHYVISVHHTQRRDLYITVWAPDDKGYRWALSRAGKYSEEHVRAHFGYYNSGINIAVPCHVLDAIAVPPIPGHHDNDAGPCVPNTRASWKAILANVIEPPKHKPEPAFQPITITLETAEEAEAFWEMLESAVCDTDASASINVKICNWFSNAAQLGGVQPPKGGV